MSISRSPRVRGLVVLGGLILAGGAAGCGAGNPNEKEFLQSAPPGKPPENPNETVSERRARTRSVGKNLAAIESKLEAATSKQKAEAQKKATAAKSTP